MLSGVINFIFSSYVLEWLDDLRIIPLPPQSLMHVGVLVGQVMLFKRIFKKTDLPTPKELLITLGTGYLWAWIGHFFFEKNQPATFKYPVYSLMGDFAMYFGLLTG